MSSAGKTTLARNLRTLLNGTVIDGDDIRNGAKHLPKGMPPFGRTARHANVLHAAKLARVHIDCGENAFVALISPYRDAREEAFALLRHDRLLVVHLTCPISELARRDTKNLYNGRNKSVSGVDQPYEEPGPSEQAITLDTSLLCPECCFKAVLRTLENRGMWTRGA